jgi:hypothetical protein
VLELRDARDEILHREVLAARSDMAARRLTLAMAARRRLAAQDGIAERLDAPVLGDFRAMSLPWEELKRRAAGPAASGAADTLPGLPEVEDSPLGRGGVWYNVLRLDLSFTYAREWNDRSFVDETNRERGYSPGVQLTLELPLDFYRAGRAFRQQVEARQDRRRLRHLSLERRLQARARDVELAVEEAVARVQAAEATWVLFQEDLRIATLRAESGETRSRLGADVEVLDAELAALDARIELTRARGGLARRLFERHLIRGGDPRELVLGVHDPASPREYVSAACMATERIAGLR